MSTCATAQAQRARESNDTQYMARVLEQLGLLRCPLGFWRAYSPPFSFEDDPRLERLRGAHAAMYPLGPPLPKKQAEKNDYCSNKPSSFSACMSSPNSGLRLVTQQIVNAAAECSGHGPSGRRCLVL